MAVTNFRFTVSGRIEFEAGSSRKIGDHVRGFGGQKVFISTDKGVVDIVADSYNNRFLLLKLYNLIPAIA